MQGLQALKECPQNAAMEAIVDAWFVLSRGGSQVVGIMYSHAFDRGSNLTNYNTTNKANFRWAQKKKKPAGA